MKKIATYKMVVFLLSLSISNLAFANGVPIIKDEAFNKLSSEIQLHLATMKLKEYNVEFDKVLGFNETGKVEFCTGGIRMVFFVEILPVLDRSLKDSELCSKLQNEKDKL